MLKARVYDLSLFFTALAIAFGSDRILNNHTYFLKALVIFWVFASLYYHLRVFYKNGSTTIDYGISYGLSFVIFAGPLGLFIFEFIYRFTVYFYKKWTKTADPSELMDTFYNIGTFVITNSAAYFLYMQFHSGFQSVPFGFWILLFLLACISSYLSGAIMVMSFYLIGELKSFKEGFEFIFKGISLLDYAKVSFTNGLLFIFLKEERWEILISLFILNYIVSRSFHSKSQSIQHKLERDKFKQMAYTDFLTGVYNRSFMDKKMEELNHSGESIGIVVADIDDFKRINDSFNHAVGDKVIQHFAAALKSYLTDEDFLFRSGGEEFTLCLRKRSFEQTNHLVNEILSGIDNNFADAEFRGENISISYTASFGLYFYKTNGQISMEKAYILADQLMLQSKRHGKNRVAIINALLNKEVV